MEAIVINGEYWACSNHASIKAKAKLIGKRGSEDQVIKIEKVVTIEKPFINGNISNGDKITLIIKEPHDKYSCSGKVVSLNNDIMSVVLTSDENRDNIDELVKSINK